MINVAHSRATIGELYMQIPQKSFFRFHEVGSVVGVKPYVLRFWESEFKEISPINSSSGEKLYEHKDLQIFALIKKLLFDDKMTIEEAKIEISRLLLAEKSTDVTAEATDVNQDLVNIEHAACKLKEVVTLINSIKEKHNWC